jgi:hypothetical protein
MCKSTSISSLPSNYLGIPLIDNPLRNISWEDLLSKFRKRLPSWNFCSLNILGHLILLEFVLQDLPVYMFSALATPIFILTIIRNILRNFLWKGAKDGHKRALVSWKKKCRPKHTRGLGLRDRSILNKVLSEKMWWRRLKRPHDLWVCLWRRKYTPITPNKELIIWND